MSYILTDYTCFLIPFVALICFEVDGAASELLLRGTRQSLDHEMTIQTLQVPMCRYAEI